METTAELREHGPPFRSRRIFVQNVALGVIIPVQAHQTPVVFPAFQQILDILGLRDTRTLTFVLFVNPFFKMRVPTAEHSRGLLEENLVFGLKINFALLPPPTPLDRGVGLHVQPQILEPSLLALPVNPHPRTLAPVNGRHLHVGIPAQALNDALEGLERKILRLAHKSDTVEVRAQRGFRTGLVHAVPQNL